LKSIVVSVAFGAYNLGKVIIMHIPKNYFHDRLVLVLLTINSFLAALLSILILLRMDSSRAESYIVQYRANLGVDAFHSGSGSAFFAFIGFALLVLIFHTLLSMKVYPLHRQFAIAVLCLGLLLLVMTLFVSNALLVQR
jgi:hypothetical protein